MANGGGWKSGYSELDMALIYEEELMTEQRVAMVDAYRVKRGSDRWNEIVPTLEEKYRDYNGGIAFQVADMELHAEYQSLAQSEGN